MGSPLGGLLLPDHAKLTAGDYTRVILFDGGLLIGSAVSVGLVRVTSLAKELGVGMLGVLEMISGMGHLLMVGV